MNEVTHEPVTSAKIFQARLSLIAAAILWSLGSFYTRVLTKPTGLGLDEPHLSSIQIAFYRSLFAGLSLVVLLRWRDCRWNGLMLAMMACFTIMSALYLSALSLGSAANAIFLQNSAPVWVYLIGVYLLGHVADRRNRKSVIVALTGTLVIVIGNGLTQGTAAGEETAWLILLMGLGSGITYAGVVLFLNQLKSYSAAWLMILNLLGTALGLGFWIVLSQEWPNAQKWFQTPTTEQLLFLFLFGVTQMASAYWLFTRSLRWVSAQEAGIITLLEPVLNPVWAYLISPKTEVPTIWTVFGGVILLAALVGRYWQFSDQKSN